MSYNKELNYRYLGCAILFFMMTFYFLRATKKSVHSYDIVMQKNDDSTIKVITQKGAMHINKNNFELHMDKIKKNISKLSKHITKTDCPTLKKYLRNAKINTKNYIELNSKNLNNFCDNKNNIFNDKVFEERNLLKKKLDKKTKRDDIGNVSDDHIRYELLDLIIDIDIILFLMKSSICDKGRVDLSSLDKVILELYRNNCSDLPPEEFDDYNKIESFNGKSNVCNPVCTINTPTPCYDDDNYYLDTTVNNRLWLDSEIRDSCDNTILMNGNHDALFSKKNPPTRPSDESAEKIDITDVNMIKETFENTKVNNHMSTPSQAKERELKCNAVRLGKQLTCSSYNTGFIEFNRDYQLERNSQGILDTKTASSLMNDYNNITPCY